MLLCCLSICTRSVLLLRAQIVRKAKEEAAASHQVLSSPLLPGGCLCSAASKDFSLAFLYCQLLIDPLAAFSPASSPPCSLASNVDPGTLFCWSPEASRQLRSRQHRLLLLLPSSRDCFLHNARSGGAPQLGEGSPLFHTFSRFELSHC